MKRIAKIILFLLLAVAAAHASPSFGVHAAIGTAGFSSEESIDPGLNYSAGAVSGVPIGEGIELQPQFLFTYRRYAMSGGLLVGSSLVFYEATSTDMALELPLLFRLELTSEFFLLAGPQFGYLLSSDLDMEPHPGGKTISQTEDATDECTRFEYGLTLGSGYQITDAFSMNIRYNYGLNAPDKDAETDARLYQIQLGGTLLFE